MYIKGWVRSSLIDYPEHIATVVFTGGCNFLCPMCHNADLVLRSSELPDTSEDEIFSYLHKRAGLLDGVVISGGEPTLQPDLIPFSRRLRALGYDIKLDTNGSRPDVIAELLQHNLVDFIAMDIKAPPGKYPELSGMKCVDCNLILDSLKAILDHGIAYELRTTVVPRLLTCDDIAAITRWLAASFPGQLDSGHYVLQQFRGIHTLEPSLENYTPYPSNQLKEMARVAQHWLPEVKVRGI